MRCVDRIRGVCPYVSSFGCRPSDRDAGMAAGRCVFELATLRTELESTTRDGDVLPEGKQRLFVAAAARWASALVYLKRARAWQLLVSEREIRKPATEAFASPEARTAERYVDAGHARMLRALAELKPMLEEITTLKAACSTSRAMAQADEILRQVDPNWDRPFVLGDSRVASAST